MAYQTRYEWAGPGEDGRAYIARLLQEGWGGGVDDLTLEGATPFELLVGKEGDDVDAALSEARCRLRVRAENELLLAEVEDPDAGAYRLDIYEDGGLIFRGAVEPSLGGRDTAPRAVVTVEAKSGLDYLEDVAHPFEAGLRVTLLELVRQSLALLGYTLPLYVVCEWRPHGLGGCPLSELRADTAVFFDDEGNPRSARFVIEQVLGRFEMNLRQSQGAWRLVQPQALYASTTVRWRFSAAGDLVGTEPAYDGLVGFTGAAGQGLRQHGREDVRRRPAYKRASVVYAHGKVGRRLIQNGSFGQLGDNGQPAAWQTSDVSRTRLTNGTYELDAVYHDEPLDRFTGELPPLPTWIVFQETDPVAAGSTPPGILSFTLRLKGREGATSGGPATRPVPWRLSCGTKSWDAVGRAWVAGEHWNYADAAWSAETTRVELADWPESERLRFEVGAVIDTAAVPVTANPSAMQAADWDAFVAGAHLGDVIITLLDGAAEEPSVTETAYALSDPGRAREDKDAKTFVIGGGPTSAHPARLAFSDGTMATDWQVGEDYGGGPSGDSLDDLHARQILTAQRSARAARYLTLLGDPAGTGADVVRAHEALVVGGGAHWPVHWRRTPIRRRMGGAFVRIRRDGEVGLAPSYAAATGATPYLDLGGRAELLRQFSNQIQSLLGARYLTRTTEVVGPGSLQAVKVEQRAAELGRAGMRVVLMDPRTLERHELTLTAPLLAGSPDLAFEPYAFPRPIPKGAPLFESSADVLASLMLAEGGLRVLILGEAVSLLTQAYDAEARSNVDVDRVQYPIAGGTELYIRHRDGRDDTVVYATAFVDRSSGPVSVPISDAAGDPVTITAAVGDELFLPGVTGRADLQVLASRISAIVTQQNPVEVIAEIAQEVPAGPVAELPLTRLEGTNVDWAGLKVGQTVAVPDANGTLIAWRVAAAAAPSPGPLTLDIEDKTIGAALPAGAPVTIPSTQLDGRLDIVAGQVALKASLEQLGGVLGGSYAAVLAEDLIPGDERLAVAVTDVRDDLLADDRLILISLDHTDLPNYLRWQEVLVDADADPGDSVLAVADPDGTDLDIQYRFKAGLAYFVRVGLADRKALAGFAAFVDDSGEDGYDLLAEAEQTADIVIANGLSGSSAVVTRVSQAEGDLDGIRAETVLKAEVSNGVITKLAAIRLDAAISGDGDDLGPGLITLDGEVQTTHDIRSQNYSAGSAGWIIDGAGNAEFNDVTLRGEIQTPDWTGAGTGGFRLSDSGLEYDDGNPFGSATFNSSGLYFQYDQFSPSIRVTRDGFFHGANEVYHPGNPPPGGGGSSYFVDAGTRLEIDAGLIGDVDLVPEESGWGYIHEDRDGSREPILTRRGYALDLLTVGYGETSSYVLASRDYVDDEIAGVSGGSGGDADTLDGYDSSDFWRKSEDVNAYYLGGQTQYDFCRYDTSPSGFIPDGTWWPDVDGTTGLLTLKFRTGGAWRTIWQEN